MSPFVHVRVQIGTRARAHACRRSRNALTHTHTHTHTNAHTLHSIQFSDVWLSSGVVDGTGGIVVDGALVLYNVTLEANVSYSW